MVMESTFKCHYKFGQIYGGFTISSGNSDENGYGNFEYAIIQISCVLHKKLSGVRIKWPWPTIDDPSEYLICNME